MHAQQVCLKLKGLKLQLAHMHLYVRGGCLPRGEDIERVNSMAQGSCHPQPSCTEQTLLSALNSTWIDMHVDRTGKTLGPQKRHLKNVTLFVAKPFQSEWQKRVHPVSERRPLRVGA